MKLHKWCEINILDSDGECNSIVIKYYTWNPNRPLDAHQKKMVDTFDYKPLFYCEEKWEWNGRDYTKTQNVEKMLTKSATRKLEDVLKPEPSKTYHNISNPDKYKVPVGQLGDGCHWYKPKYIEE